MNTKQLIIDLIEWKKAFLDNRIYQHHCSHNSEENKIIVKEAEEEIEALNKLLSELELTFS